MAVAAAAESVISEVSDLVRVVACYGNRFRASSPWLALRANSYATIRCGVDIPSPMYRKTYLGGAANATAAVKAKQTPINGFSINSLPRLNFITIYQKSPRKSNRQFSVEVIANDTKGGK